MFRALTASRRLHCRHFFFYHFLFSLVHLKKKNFFFLSRFILYNIILFQVYIFNDWSTRAVGKSGFRCRYILIYCVNRHGYTEFIDVRIYLMARINFNERSMAPHARSLRSLLTTMGNLCVGRIRKDQDRSRIGPGIVLLWMDLRQRAKPQGVLDDSPLR